MATAEYLHICDYAFQADGGKPCIIGIFENIHSQVFPVTHAFMAVAVQLRGRPNERIPIELTVGKPDHPVIIRTGGEATTGSDGGAFLNFTMIATVFPDPGEYSVILKSGTQTLASDSISLKQIIRQDPPR